MIAAYSSGVAVMRLLDAILGTSPATWIWAKRPSGVKIKMPLGVSPNGNDFLPSGAVTSATTKFQVPTIWSLSPWYPPPGYVGAHGILKTLRDVPRHREKPGPPRLFDVRISLTNSAHP